MPFDDDAYRDEVGVPELHGEPGYTPLERLTARPTLEVSQIEGGGRYTVIPAVARAYLTCRLVPDQDPARVAAAIARHVIHHCPPGVTVSVEEVPGGIPAYAIRRDHPALAAAEEALHAVYPGRRVLRTRAGGTLPGGGAPAPRARARHAAVLVLELRRVLPRPQRVLPAEPARRGHECVGAAARSARGEALAGALELSRAPRTAYRPLARGL